MLRIKIKTILLKKRVLAILIPVLLVTGYYVFFVKSSIADEDVIAFVNGDPIFLRDLEERMSVIRVNYPPDTTVNLSDIRNAMINRMIVEKLAIQDAKRLGIKINKQELNLSAKNIKQGYSEEEFSQLLLSQFVDPDDWMKQLRHILLIEKLLSKQTIEKINVSESEIRDHYEKYYKNRVTEPRVKIAQVFTSSKEKAQNALEDIKHNMPFEAVVKKYSESPESKNDGVIGVFAKDEGPDVFDIAFTMQEEQISDIIKSAYGYHIIKLLQIIPPHESTYEDMRSNIINEIVAEKENKHYEEWLESRFRHSKILKNVKLIESIK